LSPHDNAMLMWHSLGSTDEFYQNVYDYYIGKGLRNIVLAQVLNLVSLAFVACFAVFLAYGIDYSLIRTKNRLIDVIAPGFPGTLPIGIKLFMIVFLLFWTWQLVRVVYDARQVYPMRDFFEYVLDIPREDIETIDWNIVVQKITELREKDIASGRQSSVQAKRIDAMDITNRIMRKENYLIALFNRDLLNLANPFPMVPFVGSRETLTKTLEWNLSFCLFNYVFDDKGQLRKRFLRDHRRTVLADGLRRRFIFMGVINLLLAPFVVVFLLLYFFFRYAEEIYRNPGSVGMRTYSTLARWKFRGFNELPHVFQQRLNRSYEPAVKYLEQFPNEMMAIFARFTSLITGAFAGVLLILAVLDPDLSLQFEITPNRSVLFYIGLFGGILAMSRGMIPSDHETFDPAGAFNVMASYTLYMPTEWRDRTHTLYVRDEMSKMFAPKILLFIDELLGIVFTPFILLFSLSKCSAEVVDFFREFSVHVDGVGYVCSFAKFDFKRHGNIKFGAPARVDNQYLTSKNGKMEQSFLAFKANHPTWEPRDPAASTFLNR
ncbi:APG9-domain-containing protein, partial [Ramicandelaber brevisporus]